MRDEYEAFPQGVVVFFRTLADDKSMARSIHLNGRVVAIGSTRNMNAHEDDYIILDDKGKFLGCYPRDYVSAILPVETIGPAANADHPPLPSQH